MSLVLLETERLRLSGWRADQLGDLVALHGDPETARYLSGSGRPWTREQCAGALAKWMGLFATRRLGKLRLERLSDGVLVGRAGFGLHAPTGEAEIGFTLFPQHRGQGYVAEAAGALRDWFFESGAGERFIGFADIRNEPSLKALRALGMAPTHVAPFEGNAHQFHEMTRDQHDRRARG